MLMRKLSKKILDLLLPFQCVLTGKIVEENRGVSEEAFKKIKFISSPCCDRCGAPLEYESEACPYCAKETYAFQHARSAFEYDENTKPIILQYKYSDRLSLTPVFANWLAQYGKDILSDADILLPVPLHAYRLRKRMYN